MCACVFWLVCPGQAAEKRNEQAADLFFTLLSILNSHVLVETNNNNNKPIFERINRAHRK